MNERELREYRWLIREIAHERDRLARCKRDADKAGIASIIEEKIERSRAAAEQVERYIADVRDPVVRMLMVERYINGRTWGEAGRRVGWRGEDAARKIVMRYLRSGGG